MVVGVQTIGIFPKMYGKEDKSETQRTAQDMDKHGENCSWKVERDVLIVTYFKE